MAPLTAKTRGHGPGMHTNPDNQDTAGKRHELEGWNVRYEYRLKYFLVALPPKCCKSLLRDCQDGIIIIKCQAL